MDVDGDTVGDIVGSEVVGDSVGDTVGSDMVGDSVGDIVGDVVGCDVVGNLVGDIVGLDNVGGSVHPKQVNRHWLENDASVHCPNVWTALQKVSLAISTCVHVGAWVGGRVQPKHVNKQSGTK